MIAGPELVNSLDLVEQARAGGEEAARLLYERYTRRLLGLVHQHISHRFRSRFDADDVLNSTWRTFFRDSQRFTFDDDQAFWKLLTTIALNKVRRYVERNGTRSRDPRREQQCIGDLYDDLSNRPGPLEILQAAELMESLVDRLDRQSADVLTLRCEGLSQLEIAEHLTISDRTVRRCMQRIRAVAEAILVDEAA